ncbi:L-threonylcarbamoyladenylate synthase [Candidatus Electronema sp. TJ]|uniref:L-threonylcarbamoyladenylate synthase n=1 Tax=Candidatus Electronema sp. TJ TaxID=3401573 RepID=UPI003AA9D56E
MIVPASAESAQEAARLLRQGRLIAFPTETYYGLGVDPFNSEALQRIFAVKRRTEDKPVLLLVADPSQVPLLAEDVPDVLRQLMGCCWPGPLTLVFPAKKNLPQLLTGGSGTVGIRQSPDATARLLLTAFGGPVTATSANRSGQPAAVTAVEVEAAFGAEIDLILDGGRTPGGAGSTLIGWNGQELRCFREGRVPLAEIARLLAPAAKEKCFFRTHEKKTCFFP